MLYRRAAIAVGFGLRKVQIRSLGSPPRAEIGRTRTTPLSAAARPHQIGHYVRGEGSAAIGLLELAWRSGPGRQIADYVRGIWCNKSARRRHYVRGQRVVDAGRASRKRVHS